MAITATIQRFANQGRGPVSYGSLGEETFELNSDGSGTTVVLTSSRMRKVFHTLGTEATVTVSGKTATLTFAAVIPNGLKKYVRLIGLGR